MILTCDALWTPEEFEDGRDSREHSTVMMAESICCVSRFKDWLQELEPFWERHFVFHVRFSNNDFKLANMTMSRKPLLLL